MMLKFLAEMSLWLFVICKRGNLWIVKYIVDAKEEYLVGADNLKIIP
jgi:hypothetical protein